jgi:hypothetical protein
MVAGCAVGAPARTLPNGSPAVVVDALCAERLRPFLTALQRVTDELGDDLTHDRYEQLLEDAQAVQSVTGFGELSETCNQALGTPLQRLLLDHRDARIRWNLCRIDDDCDEAQVLDVVRRIWQELTGDLERIRYALP